jgi:hypothetical protein
VELQRRRRGGWGQNKWNNQEQEDGEGDLLSNTSANQKGKLYIYIYKYINIYI